MVQEWEPLRVQDKLLQIDGAGEEGGRGRDHHVRLAIKADLSGSGHFEGVEEGERSRIDF